MSVTCHHKQRAIILRAKMLQAIRSFFTGKGHLEVDTPLITNALLPETHIDAISCTEGFLIPSPELYMKSLLGADYGNIFQICKCFRAAERGKRHLPEFTMLEWYSLGIDYQALMEECADLIIFVAAQLGDKQSLNYNGKTVSLAKPWHKIILADAFARFATVSLAQALSGDCFDEIYAMEVEPQLPCDKPVFIYDYPVSMGAFAKTKKNNPKIAERFELYIGGLEVANAYSEINNPHEQQQRFDAARVERLALGKQCYPIPPAFLQELENMPDCAGIALGIDRLAMIFANTKNIADVVAFTPKEVCSTVV